MSGHDDDPFQRKDTRPFLGKTDRRESLRSDVAARVHVGDQVIETEGNVSLGGFFIPVGFPGSELDLGTETTCEILVPEGARQPGEPETFTLATVVSPTPGGRPGCYLQFSELDFDGERRIARLLDETSR